MKNQIPIDKPRIKLFIPNSNPTKPKFQVKVTVTDKMGLPVQVLRGPLDPKIEILQDLVMEVQNQ